VEVKWSQYANLGFIKVWINGGNNGGPEPDLEFKDIQTLFPKYNGSPGSVYLKMGLYRAPFSRTGSAAKKDFILYHDDVKQKPISIDPPAPPDLLPLTINCESGVRPGSAGESQFTCDAFASGGVPPYTFTWTAVSNATIQQGENEQTVRGICNGGTGTAVKVVVKDSSNPIQQVQGEERFECNAGLWP
jgi:hypothetical protein